MIKMLKNYYKAVFNGNCNNIIYSCFSPQTFDLESFEIEVPINHLKAHFIKSNDFYLNYVSFKL